MMHAILLTDEQLSSVVHHLRVAANKYVADVAELRAEYPNRVAKLAEETARLLEAQTVAAQQLAQSIEDTPALSEAATRLDVLDTLVKSGLEIGATIQRFAKDNSDADRELIEACPTKDGEFECDGPEGSVLSRGADNGAYVLGWIWTEFDDDMTHTENRPEPDGGAEVSND